MKAPLYLRVSTRDGSQGTDNQRLQLRQLCTSQGWQIVGEYEDHESGNRADRTQFRQMLQDASTRKWDLLVFWAMDRFTREGTLATLKYLELLESYGVRWRSLTEPWIDSAGPFREVIISLLASLAEQERLRVSERVQAGLQRARQSGIRIGRPRRILDRSHVVELRWQGLSFRQIVRKLSLGEGTVRRAYQVATHAPELRQN